MSDPSIGSGVTKVTNHGVIGAARDCPFWRARGNKAPLDAPARLAKVRFSIAARVKLRPDISCRYPLALRRMTPHGALASLRGRRKPPHDGMRRMGRCNLRDGLAAGRRQDRRTLRTHPTRRPREDIFLPEQNALSPLPAIFLGSAASVQATVGTAALSLLQRNSLPSTHIRFRTTARRLATATMARRIPRR
jgi:hypothetical protein